MRQYECPNCGADLKVSEETEQAHCQCCKRLYRVNRDGEFRDGMWRDLTTLTLVQKGAAKKRIVKVIDHWHVPIDCLRANWCLWDVCVEFEDGTTEEGTMQGDGCDLWAFESYEPEEVFYADFS